MDQIADGFKGERAIVVPYRKCKISFQKEIKRCT